MEKESLALGKATKPIRAWWRGWCFRLSGCLESDPRFYCRDWTGEELSPHSSKSRSELKLQCFQCSMWAGWRVWLGTMELCAWVSEDVVVLELSACTVDGGQFGMCWWPQLTGVCDLRMGNQVWWTARWSIAEAFLLCPRISDSSLSQLTVERYKSFRIILAMVHWRRGSCKGAHSNICYTQWWVVPFCHVSRIEEETMEIWKGIANISWPILADAYNSLVR